MDDEVLSRTEFLSVALGLILSLIPSGLGIPRSRVTGISLSRTIVVPVSLGEILLNPGFDVLSFGSENILEVDRLGP